MKKMSIIIENFKFQTIIGILDFERINSQEIIVFLQADYKFDIKNRTFIDYAIIYKLIKDSMINMKFKLIEEALIYLFDLISQKYNFNYLKIKITKPSILLNAEVSVEMEENFA